MRTECIDAVVQAIGRSLTQTEIQGIEARVRSMFPAAREALIQHGQAVTPRAMLDMAGQLAAKSMEHDAQVKKLRIARTIEAHDRLSNYFARADDKFKAMKRLLAFSADAKGSVMSMESQMRAIRDDAIGQLTQALEASHPKFFSLLEDVEGVKALLREMHGKDTGIPEAKAGAKAWLDVTESLRKRFNESGGTIGKLEDWGMPHHHSQPKVAKAGRDAWVNDILPAINRDKYVNPDGTLMNDAQLVEVLSSAWETIATNGYNKIEPGGPSGRGARANYGAEARALHFKDADSWIEYQTKYGELGFYESMISHVEGLSRSIAMVETLGPNPNHTFNYFRDVIGKETALKDPTKTGQVKKQQVAVDNLYDTVAGNVLPVANERLATFFDTVRNSLVASRLGSAFISSVPDEATMRLTAMVNNLPEMELFKNELATLNPANAEELALAKRAGLAAEVMIGEVNRFGQDTLGRHWSSKMANATMRVSGLNAITAARKRAFGVTMMNAVGRLVETKAFDRLDPSDNRILLSKGITETDWNIWKLAKQENWGRHNLNMLTPESLRAIPDEAIKPIAEAAGMSVSQARNKAVTRLLGTLLEEMDMAVITPGMAERSIMQSNLQRGTWKGELTRSFFLFKSFPLSMIYRHWNRAAGMPGGWSRAKYASLMVASTTAMGAVAQQIYEVINGRDPRNMIDTDENAHKFWVQAMLKGGALSLYGDFMFSTNTRYGTTPISAALGPVAGLAEDMIKLTQENAIQYAEGKDTRLGAEAIRFVKSNLPGANLWYTRAAMDHLVFQQLMEMASPGYNAHIESKMRNEFGQSFWWAPGETAPERAPDVTQMIGG